MNIGEIWIKNINIVGDYLPTKIKLIEYLIDVDGYKIMIWDNKQKCFNYKWIDNSIVGLVREVILNNYTKED